MQSTRRWTLGIVLVLMTAFVAAACAPSPESESWFEGGTYPIEVTIPSQTYTTTTQVLGGLGTCTATATTPSLELPGASVTLGAATIDPMSATATIPTASVQLPAVKLAVGSLSLWCFGTHLGSIGVAVELEAAASVQSAQLDVATRTVTLSEPRITVTRGAVSFSGTTTLPPVPLEPFSVDVPSFDITL